MRFISQGPLAALIVAGRLVHIRHCEETATPSSLRGDRYTFVIARSRDTSVIARRPETHPSLRGGPKHIRHCEEARDTSVIARRPRYFRHCEER